PTVGPISPFGRLINLNSMCYDQASKIVGVIEERLDAPAFLDFMRHVYCKYQFQILRVADFQQELEKYTGTSWDEFFKNWLYGAGLSDWSVAKVKLARCPWAASPPGGRIANPSVSPDGLAIRPTGGEDGPSEPPKGGFLAALRRPATPQPYRATIWLEQKAEVNEQTVLGICLDGGDGFPVRIPIIPGAQRLTLDDPPASVEWVGPNRVKVEVTLPCKPTQIMVDPDQILVDKNPHN